jgi:carbonic anhydrase/acetyltransferase-like protein (isoleucine patch superfamily)
MQKLKYELTQEQNQQGLYRIRALRNFGKVNAGELGGWLASESNLSQDGTAWVANDAQVFNNALIFEDAQVFDNARISDDAQVLGNAWVSGNARVSDDTVVSGNARVSGNSRVYDDAQIFGRAQISGKAQVFGNTEVSGHAWVSDNARIYDDAQVFDNAWVSGKAQVGGHAWVSGKAHVSGNALVSDNAQIGGNACLKERDDFVCIHPIGSEHGILTATIEKDGSIALDLGCFRGTVKEFLGAVAKKHGDNKYATAYKNAVVLIESILCREGNK